MEYDKLDLIEKKAQDLLMALKTDTKTGYVTNALVVIVTLFLIPLVVLYIFDGASSIRFLIYLVVIAGLLILYRVRIGSAMKESAHLSSYKSIDKADKQSYITGLLRYLSSGYDVKISRLKSVRLVYMILFPLVLVLWSEMYQFWRDSQVNTGIIQFVAAFLIGCVFWYLYFQDDLHELELDQTDVDNMVGKIYTIK